MNKAHWTPDSTLTRLDACSGKRLSKSLKSFTTVGGPGSPTTVASMLSLDLNIADGRWSQNTKGGSVRG